MDQENVPKRLQKYTYKYRYRCFESTHVYLRQWPALIIAVREARRQVLAEGRHGPHVRGVEEATVGVGRGQNHLVEAIPECRSLSAIELLLVSKIAVQQLRRDILKRQ